MQEGWRQVDLPETRVMAVPIRLFRETVLFNHGGLRSLHMRPGGGEWGVGRGATLSTWNKMRVCGGEEAGLEFVSSWYP